MTVIVIMDEGKLAKEEKQTSKQRQKVMGEINLKILVFTQKSLVGNTKRQAPAISSYPASPSLGLRNELFLARSPSQLYWVEFASEGSRSCWVYRLVLYSKDKVKD